MKPPRWTAFLMALALGSQGCQEDDDESVSAETGEYRAWFEEYDGIEDPSTPPLAIGDSAHASLDFDGSEVTFELLEPVEASCSYAIGNEFHIMFLSEPQSFTTEVAAVEDGSFSFRTTADIVGDPYSIEVTGQWASANTVSGRIAADDLGGGCSGAWVACTDEADCTTVGCPDEPYEMNCDWVEGPNCWSEFAESVQACGEGSSTGEFDMDGMVCTSGDLVIEFASPVHEDHDVNAALSFQVTRDGEACFSLESSGGEQHERSWTLTSPRGDFTVAPHPEDTALQWPSHVWTCPGECSQIFDGFKLLDSGCEDVFGVGYVVEIDGDEFVFSLGLRDLLLNAQMEIFRCQL